MHAPLLRRAIPSGGLAQLALLAAVSVPAAVVLLPSAAFAAPGFGPWSYDALGAPVRPAASEELPPEPAPAAGEAYAEPVYVEELDEDGGRPFFTLGARVGLWASFIEARAEVSDANVLGTKIDMSSDLELDEWELVPYVEGFLRLGIFSLHGDYFHSQREGETTLNANLSFAGVTFAAGAPVEAEFEILSAAGWFLIHPIAFESFELGIGLGVRYYELEGTIRSRDELFPVSRTERLSGPLPFAVLALSVYPGPLEIYGQARGIYLEYEDPDQDEDIDVTALYLDAEVGVAVNLGRHFSFGAGYKGLYLLVEERGEAGAGGDERYEVANHGPIAWVRIRL